MPRLVSLVASETPALLALRRTLWQLAFVGVAISVTLARVAPQPDALALWCTLVPLAALATHYRHALLDLLLSHWHADSDHAVSRRVQRPQARRARSIHGQHRLARSRPLRDPAKTSPLAR